MNNSFCIQILKISVCLASADEHYWLTCDVSHGNCSSNLQTFTEQAYSLTKHWHRTCLTTLTTAHSKYSILALWHLQQVVKVIWQKPTLLLHTDHSNIFARWRQYAPIYSSTKFHGPTRVCLKTASQSVQLVCKAHLCARHADTQTCYIMASVTIACIKHCSVETRANSTAHYENFIKIRHIKSPAIFHLIIRSLSLSSLLFPCSPLSSIPIPLSFPFPLFHPLSSPFPSLSERDGKSIAMLQFCSTGLVMLSCCSLIILLVLIFPDFFGSME